MNPGTPYRLWKEARALLPLWAGVMALMVTLSCFRLLLAYFVIVTSYFLGVVMLGVHSFGHEFHHRTMGLLLSQPVSRRQIWWEKMAVLLLAMLGLFVTYWVINVTVNPEPLNLWLVVLPVGISFCTSPVITLFIRNSIGGTALTALGPCLVIIPSAWFFDRMYGNEVTQDLWSSFILLGLGLYSGVLLLLGCRFFGHYQDKDVFARELVVPESIKTKFAGFTSCLNHNPASHLANLMKKELRLQQPTFLIAALLMLIWFTLGIVKLSWPAFELGWVIVPPVLLGIVIPIIAGIISVAEERSLGLHDWQLMLPCSLRKQWYVKVLVAVLVNNLLSLMPTTVAIAMLSDEPRIWDSLCLNYALNLLLLLSAIYASSFSGNSLRAMLVTISLWILVMSLLGVLLNVWSAEVTFLVQCILNENTIQYRDLIRWLCNLCFAAGFMGMFLVLIEAGLSNYRRTVITRAQLLLQLTLICFFILLVACLCMIAMHIIAWSKFGG